MAQSDKSSVVLRVHPLLRWGPFVLIAVFAIQLVWLIQQSLLFPSLNNFHLIEALFDCLFIGGLIYLIVFSWTLAFRFDPAHLVLWTIPYPPYRSFRIAYSDIVTVERALGGYAFQIVTGRNTLLRLPGFELEGGLHRPLMELAKRLPAEKFSEEALAEAQHKTGWVSVVNVLSWVGLPLLLVVIQTGSGMYPSLIPTAWHKADIQTGVPSVESATEDPDGSIWLLSDLRLDEYHVRHVAEGGTSDWALPKQFYSYDHLGIARDQNGNPWVIDKTNIYQWDGTTWQTHAYPDGAQLGDVDRSWFTVEGSRIWGVDIGTNGRRILRMDVGDGSLQSQFLSLPEEALRLNSIAEWIKPGPEGSLAMYASGDQQHAFYLWAGGQWARITELEEERAPQWNITIDRDEKGNIYLVQKYRKEDGRPVIGVFRPDQSTWTWSGVYLKDESWIAYSQIQRVIVDTNGRIWTVVDESGNGRPPDYISVLEEAGGRYQEVRHYTEDNSGISGTDLIMTNTGRIWAVGDYPAWIDSRQTNLPQPLPEWLAFITGDAGSNVRFVAELILILAVFVLVIFSWIRSPQSKPSRPSKRT
jgi:hypothetical protein